MLAYLACWTHVPCRQVKTLINQTQDAGYRSVIWDATNDYGNPVSADIYLYQIQAVDHISTKKMLLLKQILPFSKYQSPQIVG